MADNNVTSGVIVLVAILAGLITICLTVVKVVQIKQGC